MGQTRRRTKKRERARERERESEIERETKAKCESESAGESREAQREVTGQRWDESCNMRSVGRGRNWKRMFSLHPGSREVISS